MTRAIGYEPRSKFPYQPIDIGTIEYEGIPESVRRGRKGGFRGRIGVEEDGPLYNLVSSKQARDITRKGAWVSKGPFDKWAEDHQGYWGGNADYDNDGINEFVVRRGNETGPIVAVNGYTTKASDYPWKAKFYDTYKTGKERRGKSVRTFMNEYYGPKYADNHMDIESYDVNPAEDDFTQMVKKHGGYRTPTPKALSPYQAITKVVHEAIKTAINEIAEQDGMDYETVRHNLVDKYGSNTFGTIFCSQIYGDYITKPIEQAISDAGLMEQYKQKFMSNKRSDYEYNEKDFKNWLHARKEYKEKAKSIVASMLNSEQYTNTFNSFVIHIIQAFRTDED